MWRSRRRYVPELTLALLSACTTVLMCFIAAEVWTRLARPYMTPDTERAASLEYEPTVLSRHAFPQVVQGIRDPDGQLRAEINARGYRGRAFAVPKPPGVIRVVVLGGSAAFDANAAESQDWPHLVETRLHSAGYDNVEVINAGTPGHATWDVLGRLYAEIWMIQPDYVVIYEEWNDLKYFR